MWALDNRTPYAADRNWTRDKAGEHWWLVAVRATYLIDPTGFVTAVPVAPTPGYSDLRSA